MPHEPIRVALAAALLSLVACNMKPKGTPSAEPAPAASVAPALPAAADGATRLGAPIAPSVASVSLADVAKAPSAYADKTFATTGTVTAVCQHMGCWMEIADEASAAHVKMAGHAFFVPKTASGKKARVLGKLVKVESEGASCEGEGHEGAMAAHEPGKAKGKGCRAEAEEQLGRPLAKLELVAEGVEIL